MSLESRGTLSLWIFREESKDYDESALKEEFGIDSFNEDLLEVGGSEDWKQTPLEEAFRDMSYVESWGYLAIERAHSLGVTACRRAFIILDFMYDPKMANRLLPDEPLFVGTFEFDDDDDL